MSNVDLQHNVQQIKLQTIPVVSVPCETIHQESKFTYENEPMHLPISRYADVKPKKWEQKLVQIRTLEGEFSVTMWATGTDDGMYTNSVVNDFPQRPVFRCCY